MFVDLKASFDFTLSFPAVVGLPTNVLSSIAAILEESRVIIHNGVLELQRSSLTTWNTT